MPWNAAICTEDAVITHLKLDNFKIWRSTGPMHLAPVTLLLPVRAVPESC
jgi:hypothetical protein